MNFHLIYMMRNKLSLLFFVSVSFIGKINGDALPVSYSLDRYSHIWEKEIFILGSLDEGGRDVDSSSRYALVGIFDVGGLDYAIVEDEKTGDHLFVSGVINAKGFVLISINKDSNPENVFAIIEQGSQSFSVKYSQDKISILKKES